jgi:hypothetical protein
MTLHSGCTSGQDSADSARLLVDNLASRKLTRMTPCYYYLNLGLGGIVLPQHSTLTQIRSNSSEFKFDRQIVFTVSWHRKCCVLVPCWAQNIIQENQMRTDVSGGCKGNRKTHQSSSIPSRPAKSVTISVLLVALKCGPTDREDITVTLFSPSVWV